MRKACVAGVSLLTLALAAAWALGAGDAKPYEPLHFETKPGTCFYLFQDARFWKEGTLSVVRHATADCLTPPVALEFAFPDVDGPAGIDRYDLSQVLGPQSEDRPEDLPALPEDAIGVSFWVKGDGSSGYGSVEAASEEREGSSLFYFPLSDRKWHRILLKWADFSPAPDVKMIGMLGFGLKEGSARPAKYVIDALRFVKTADEDPELAVLAAAANERKAVEAEVTVRPSPLACTYNRAAIGRARAKVQGGIETKWIAYGDSVTVPVQLWNIPEDLRVTKYAYYASAARTLEDEFGGRISIAVNAVGGRQLNEDFQSLVDSLAREKADLLILLAGDTVPNYEVLMPKVLAAAEAAGTEVLVVIPTYDPQPLRVASFDWLRRWCIENGVACADARSYLLGVPQGYWGDTTANPSHPNALGHRLIGQVLVEMFR
jgi:hypothetical protein